MARLVFMWFFPQFPADFLLNKPVEHVECVRCYPGEIRPEEFQHLPVVTRWSGNNARRWKSTCKGADGREDGHLKQEVFQFTIRPGNKITEAVIVFDYRIVLGLFYLISRFGSQWIWFIGSHISENSGSHRKTGCHMTTFLRWFQLDLGIATSIGQRHPLRPAWWAVLE
jgi:hypothetical protein